MKKSTIFLVILVYIVAFFAVGLFGIAIRSNYEMNYVSEILVETVDDQPTLVEKSHVRTEKTQNIVDDEYRRYENTYNYTVDYVQGVVVKLRVKVLPTNSTYSDFSIIYENTESIKYEKVDETLVYVTFFKKRTASFALESSDGNKTQTNVQIRAK